MYQEKYLKYKEKYLQKSGKCKPYSFISCGYNHHNGKCVNLQNYNIRNDQKKCICSYKTHKCVNTNSKSGVQTIKRLQKIINTK